MCRIIKSEFSEVISESMRSEKYAVRKYVVRKYEVGNMRQKLEEVE